MVLMMFLENRMGGFTAEAQTTRSGRRGRGKSTRRKEKGERRKE
jgi:hypothetical protein